MARTSARAAAIKPVGMGVIEASSSRPAPGSQKRLSRNMGIALRVSVRGMAQLKAKLAKMQGVLNNPQIPLMKAAIQVQAETVRNFDEGGRPETWMPLSMMSLFIRAHRANDVKRRQDGNASHLSDSGRLRNSFIPFVSSGGGGFGVGTNVTYARLMQEGGVTEAQTIPISGFKRRKAKAAQNQKYFGDTGWTKKSKDYDLHLSGGATIPARPFFPRSISELSAWGYQAKIKEIFANYFHGPL